MHEVAFLLEGHMPPPLTKLPLPSHRLAVSAVGALGALLVHTVLILPFVLDLSLPSRKTPDESGAGASTLLSIVQPELTVVLIGEPAHPVDAPPLKLEELGSRGLAPLDLQVVVLSPDSSAAGEAAPTELRVADSPAIARDSAQHALLFGRYLGQVQARIERAWIRPRSYVAAPRFFCRARIEQDRRGDVMEVRLDHCNGTERWQQSLLNGIRTASPLPAPPDVSVYADVLWLSFSSEPFREGSSTQGFEPETRTASAGNPSALNSFQRFVTGGDFDPRRRIREDSTVLHLTIIGTPSAEATAPSELPLEPPPPTPPATPILDAPPQ